MVCSEAAVSLARHSGGRGTRCRPLGSGASRCGLFASVSRGRFLAAHCPLSWACPHLLRIRLYVKPFPSPPSEAGC